MRVGPPYWGEPFQLCRVPGLGLMFHLRSHSRMPQNRGAPPLAWPRPCDSHGSPSLGAQQLYCEARADAMTAPPPRPLRGLELGLWDQAALIKILILPLARSMNRQIA